MASGTASNLKLNSSLPERNAERRNRVMLGLPDDFLRPERMSTTIDALQQETTDRQLAAQLQRQHISHRFPPCGQNIVGQLILTVVEASLVKNYGMTRMDPYARIRVGHKIYETHADPSGGKNPHWNKIIQCYLPAGTKTISIEIYDECSLTMDELIAYGQAVIPDAVFNGETLDTWFTLSGKQGDHKEGSIHMIFSFIPGVGQPLFATPSLPPTYTGYPLPGTSIVSVGQVGPVAAPVVMIPAYGMPAYSSVPVYTSNVSAGSDIQPTIRATASHRPLSKEELSEIESMFPSIDKQVIQSVVDACEGRREAIIDSLLQISEL